MAIYYLDIDDEITSAAARIRDSSDSRIALVLAGGARVATSRINFRLLAREAKHRNKRLAIITADPSVQSVARSAELPVYTTVGDYESAEAALVRSLGGRPADATTDVLDELALTVRPTGTPGRGGAPGATRIAGGPPAGRAAPNRAAPGRVRVPRLLVAGVALLAIAVIAVGGFFFYPSATIVLTLSEETVGPTTVSVKVDPAVTAANFQAGTVPGVAKAFPVTASGSFDATGQNVVETAATGTVTFTSEDTGRAWAISAGTQVKTADGTAFATTARVVIPEAVFLPPKRGAVDAAVAAVKPGVSGNVAANTIVNMPDVSGNGRLSVTNKSATTGGTHTVTPKVVQSDIDKAEASLWAQMEASFQAALKAPGAEPSGSTLFVESAQLGQTTCSPDPQGFVDQAVASFQLDCTGTGTALVAQMTSVTDVATARVRSALRAGYSLVEDSIATKVGAGSGQGSTLVLPVSVQGLQIQIVDVDALRAGIKGKSIDDARAFLSQYGQVEISVSPDWSSTMPSFDFRIDIQLVVPSAGASGGPSPSGIPGATTRPATAPPFPATDSGSAATAPALSQAPSATPGPTAPPSAPASAPSSGSPSASPGAS